MSKPIKTNVLRHLDAHRIPYETREYDVSDENYDGKLVADKVGLPADMIYKTLVLTGDRLKYLVCVIPVEKELDLLLLGQDAAAQSGMNVRRMQLVLILFSAYAVSVVVAVSGLVGFVGLIIPHIITVFYALYIDLFSFLFHVLKQLMRQ